MEDGGGKGGAGGYGKALPTSFSPATSENVGISPKNTDVIFQVPF